MSGIKGVDSMNMMDENPELRWSFIRKVYSIVTLQLLLIIFVVSVLVFVPLVANFFNNRIPDYVSGLVAIFAQCLAEYYHQKRLLSYFLLLIFNIFSAILVGLLCALISEKITLEAVMLSVILPTTAVVFSLTLCTFWAAKRDHDFNFLYLLRLGALLVIVLFIPFQLLFLLGKLSYMISVCLLFVIICGNIVYDTNTLIKRMSHDKYISASISLYQDVLLIFLSLLLIFSVVELIKRKII